MKNKISELEQMNDGNWYLHNTIEGFTTLKVGDNIREQLMDVEVRVKDNIIQEIVSTIHKRKPTNAP